MMTAHVLPFSAQHTLHSEQTTPAPAASSSPPSVATDIRRRTIAACT